MKRLALLISLLFTLTPAFCFQKKSKEKADLTVVSFNIRFGTPGDGIHKWSNRSSLVHSIFKKYKGAIIATQETLVRQIDEFQREIPKMGAVYRTRQEDDSKGESMALFYDKKTWEVLEDETYWLSDTPNIPGSRTWGNTLPRITTVVIFKSKINDKKVRIVNTHLDHRSQNSREKSVELILSKIQGYDQSIPTVLVGGFNAEPDDSVLEPLTQRFEDSYTGPEIEGCTFHKWNGGRHCERIDYIFYPKESGFELIDSGIDRYKKGLRFPSDHFPIFARFKLN